MKSIKKTLFFGLLLAMILGFVPSKDLFAQSKRKTIRIAGVEYPPVFFKNGTGAATDMLTELIDMQDILQRHFGVFFPKGIIPPYMVTGKISN